MTHSEAIETLKRASLYLEAKTIIDRQFPDLGNTIKNAEGYKFVSHNTVQSMLINSQIAMPFASLSQASFLKPNSPSGIAPLLNKAYFAVGNKLYIWDYYDNKDAMVLEADSEITAVAFVQPKRKVFNEAVTQLLIIATLHHIKIVAVTANNFTLVDNNMSTNTTGVVVRKIHGTTQGRIFMLGEDQNLWELDYRSEEGWFTGRCFKKLHSSSSLGFISSFFNHSIVDISSDLSGNILYQLTQESTIIVTWLEHDAFRYIVSKSEKGTQIVSIHSTSPNESRKYQLVAITNTGHRLYFTIYKDELNQELPDTLTLLYTRAPPQPINGTLSKTLYHDAVYLAVKTDNNMDELIETNPDIGHLSQSSLPINLVEFATTLPVTGKVLAMASVPMTGYDHYYINEIATTTPARQFLVLTTTGLMVLVKQRPIDMFQRLIINSEPLSEDVFSFLRHFGVTNASALAFGIISNSANPAAIQGAKAVLSRLKTQPENQFVNQDGLALFIYRNIRPIWESPMLKMDNTSVNPLSQLRSILEILRHLSNNIITNVNMTSEVEALQTLVDYLCQAIAFFLYLFDSDINTVLKGIKPEVHARLCSITLKQLLTTTEGKAFIDQLSSLLIDYEFQKNDKLMFVLDALQQHCGDFCNFHHVIVSRIIKEMHQPNQAFLIASKIANRIPHDKLNEINHAFIQHASPKYAVDLTLTCINTHATQEYYDLYADLLLTLSNQLIMTGLYTQNKDLHYTVYAKFMERGRGTDLIQASPVYLEEYLKLEMTIERLQLLSQYYISNERYEEAARSLVQLSRLPGALSMERRIELLTEAYNYTQRVTSPAKQYEMYELGKSIQELLALARNA